MRSRSRKTGATAGAVSIPIHNPLHQPQFSFEGESLGSFLKSVQREIESARAFDETLPYKFWVKQQFAVGVNEVTRVLERMTSTCGTNLNDDDAEAEAPSVCLQAILVSDCNPRWLTKHLPALSASRNVPLIFVKDKREGSLKLGNLIKLKTAIAIGIKAKGNAVNQLIKEVLSDLFVLPKLMYSNSSLTCLSLSQCYVAPQSSIEWRSLTRLDLSCMELYEHVMEKILSGCPVLYELNLINCWGLKSLEINCRSLQTLNILIWLYMKDDAVLEISAPYIHSLTLSVDHELSRKLRLVKIPSVVRANIGLLGFCHYTSGEMRNCIKEVFEDIQHVKKVELDRECIQALYMLLRKGWRLQSWRDHLIINATTSKHNTPVILDLLDSSPNLKTLIINRAYPFFSKCACCIPGNFYPQKRDTDSDLLHLKTVTITCQSTYVAFEQILSLVQVLLKRAIVLEKIVIDLKDVELSASLGNIDDISQLLLEYPRSSPEAVVVLCK